VGAANEILQGYNFIGLVERLDESLVVLQMLHGLKTSNMIYLSGKSSGSYDDGGLNNKCYYIVPSFLSLGMEEYFASEDWKDRSWNDYLMYHAVNKSIDLTIERLGFVAFEENMSRLRLALRTARSTCTTVQYPCSPGGVWNNQTDCLWEDAGCGYQSIDQLIEENEEWRSRS